MKRVDVRPGCRAAAVRLVRCIPDALVEGLGTAWSVTNGYHKMFACCNYAHAAVEATLDLRSKLAQRKLTDIEEIVVEAGPGGMALTTIEPPTVLAAKFSIPHAVAATAQLGTGNVAGVAATGTFEATEATLATSAKLSTGDLVINGVQVPASTKSDDNSSNAYGASSAIAKVAAINSVSDQTGVKAIVGPTEVAIAGASFSRVSCDDSWRVAIAAQRFTRLATSPSSAPSFRRPVARGTSPWGIRISSPSWRCARKWLSACTRMLASLVRS